MARVSLTQSANDPLMQSKGETSGSCWPSSSFWCVAGRDPAISAVGNCSCCTIVEERRCAVSYHRRSV